MALHIIWAEVQGQRKRGRGGLWLIMQSPCVEKQGVPARINNSTLPPTGLDTYAFATYSRKHRENSMVASITITVVKSDVIRTRGNGTFPHKGLKGNTSVSWGKLWQCKTNYFRKS